MQGSDVGGRVAGRSLVVADDDPRIIALVRRVLDHDFVVTPALNGSLAVESVRARRPDAVLLDLEMPTMGGLEACRRIRAAHASLPIVVLTGCGDPGSVEAAFAAGASDILAKPFAPSQLRARLQACLLRTGPT